MQCRVPKKEGGPQSQDLYLPRSLSLPLFPASVGLVILSSDGSRLGPGCPSERYRQAHRSTREHI